MNSDYHLNSSTGLLEHLFQIYVEPSTGLRLKRFSATGTEIESILVDANGLEASVVVDSSSIPHVYISYRRPGVSSIHSEIVVKKYPLTNISSETWSAVYQIGDPLTGSHPRLYLTGSPAKNPNVVFTDQDGKLVNLLFDAFSGIMTKRTELRGLIGTSVTFFTNDTPSQLQARAFGLNVYIAFPDNASGTSVTLLKLNGRTGSRVWNKSFNFGNGLSVKSGIRIVEDLTNSLVYLYARSGSERRITALDPSNGTESWVSEDYSSELSSSYGNDIQGFEMFLDTPSIQTVLTTGSVKVFKISPLDGSKAVPRTTALTGWSGTISELMVVLPPPGDTLYIPRLSGSTGDVFYQTTTSTKQIVYPDSEVGQNQLVTDSGLTRSYLIYRNNSTSQVRLSVMDFDNTLIGDHVIDSDGGQLPSISLSGTRITVSCLDFFTNFTEFVRLKVFHVKTTTPASNEWSKTVDLGDSSVTNMHPVLTMSSSLASTYLRRFDGRVSGYSFKMTDGSLSKTSSLTGLRISSRLSYNVPSSSVYLIGVKFGDLKKVVGGVSNISSLSISNLFETDLGEPLLDKTNPLIGAQTGSPITLFVGARGSDGKLYLEKRSETSVLWSIDSGVIENSISGLSVFSDNLLIFTRNLTSGNLKTYKFGLNGQTSSLEFNPTNYFPVGSTTLPPTASLIGSTLVLSSFPYDRYVVVSKTSNTSGPIHISQPQISVLHGNYRYSATFTNTSNILTITTTANHGLSANDFISIDFTSGTMIDGVYKVLSITSPTVFTLDYDKTGLASGSLTFSKTAYDTTGLSDLTEYQAIQHEDYRLISYVDDQGNLTLKRFSESETTLVFKNVESVGQLPSIFASGGDVYISFVTIRNTLTNILYLNVKRINLETLSTTWTVGTRYFPDADKTLFRTRLAEVGDRIYTYHFREDRILYGNPIRTDTGALDAIQNTAYSLPVGTGVADSRIQTIPAGTSLVEFLYPEGSLVRVITFNPETLTAGINQTFDGGDSLGLKTGVYSRVADSSLRYLVFQSGSNSGVVKFNYESGTVSWQRQAPTTRPISNLYDYLEYVVLFSITPTGQIETVKLVSDTGSTVSGLPKTTPLVGFPFGTLVGTPILYSRPDWGTVSIFLKNTLDQGGFETPLGDFIECSVFSSGVEATVTNTTSELSEYQSAVQPVMFLEGATYSQVDNILTVNYPNHGILLNARIGLRITSGGASGGTYEVIVSERDSFKVMSLESATASGNATISVFDNFFTCYYTDSENGIEMTKFVSEGYQYQVSIDPLGQFPSLLHDESQENFIYVSYMKNVTSFVDYVKLVVKRVNTFDLTDNWVSGILFMDTSATTFRPRMTVSGDKLFVGYCLSTNEIQVSALDKVSGVVSSIFNTGVSLADSSLLKILGTSSGSNLYLGYTDSSNLVIRKYSAVSPSLTLTWTVSFDRGSPGLKTELSLRQSLSGLVLSYAEGTDNYLTRLDNSGSVIWTTDVSESGSYGNKIHGFYTLNGTPLVMFVVPRLANPNLADLVCKTYDIDGVLNTSRTTFLETFDGELVVGPPLVFSRSYVDPFVGAGNVFNSLWMVYPDPTGPLYPNWVILVNRLEVTPIPVVNFSLVQTTDNQYAREDSSGMMYMTYVNDPGTNGVFINRMTQEGITEKILKMDDGGYGSVISIDDEHVYVAYSKNVLTYTSYLTIEIRKYTKTDFAFVWGVTRVFTDTRYQFFFPRLRVQGPNLFMAFTDQTGTLFVERYSAATGSLIDSMTTGFDLLASELGELSTWSSDNYFYLSLPAPSSNLLRLQKYGVVSDSISRIYSITLDGGVVGQKSGILLRTPDRDIYPEEEGLVLGFSNLSTSEYIVGRVSPIGTIVWTTSLGTITDVFTNRILGLGIYGDYTQAFLMKNNLGALDVKSFKLSPQGVIVQQNSTTTPLETANISTSVSGGTPITIQVSPVILFNRDWSSLYIEFYVNASIPFGEPVSPYDRLVVTGLSASLTYTVTVPESELSTYQFAKPPGDLITDTFLVYSHETEGVKISKTNNSGTVVSTQVVDANGQSPSLTILGNSIYVSYVYEQNGFLSTIYHKVVCYDLNLSSPTLVSAYNYPDVDSTKFRPRIVSFGDKVITHYTRESNQIIKEVVQISGSEFLTTVLPVEGEIFEGTNRLSFSNAVDQKIYLVYPTNALETEYRLVRTEEDGTIIWSKTLSHTSPITPLIRLDDSGFVAVYYNEGSSYRFYNFDKEDGSENWNTLQTISNPVANEVSNVYFVLGYTLIFSLNQTSNVFSTRKLDEDGGFINSFDTNLTGILSTADILGRIVFLSDNPWDTLYYAHYTSNPGLGSIPVSTTKFIETSAYVLPIIHPLPIPASELSEYQVAESSGEIFLVQSDQTNGLGVFRINKTTNLVTHTFTLPVSDYGFAPTILLKDDVLYLIHVEYVTTFIEFVRVRVSSLNSTDLTLNYTLTQAFPDPSPNLFRPRPCFTNSYLHMGLLRFDQEVYVLSFNPTTQEFGVLLSTEISASSIDPLALAISSSEDSVTLFLPDLTKNILVKRYSESYDNLLNTYFDSPAEWETTLDGGRLTPKSRPRVKPDMIGDSYLAYDDLLTKISPSGTVLWTSSLSGVSGRVGSTAAHGFHLFEEYPLIQTILNTNQVAYSKFNEIGEQWSSLTSSLTGFSSSNVSGTPLVLSYYPYTRTHLIYQSSNTGLYNLPGRNLVFQVSDKIPVYLTPTPPNKNVEGYQATSFLDGSANAVNYTPSIGSVLYYFDGSILTPTLTSTVLSAQGIFPSLSKFQNEVSNHVEYVESAVAFTEYQILNLRQFNGPALTSDWSQQTVLPYHTYPTAIVRTGFNYIVVLVLKDNKYINLQLRNKDTGALISTYTSYTEVSRPEDVRIMGQDDIYVSFPEGNGVRVIRFDTNGQISVRWSVLLDSDGNTKYHVRLIQNLTGRIFVAYIGKDPLETLGFLRLLSVQRTDGSVEWTKTLFEDISPTTERIHGLDNEGSFVNVTRLGLQLLDTDNATIDLITKNESYTGTRSRTIENILSGFPAYVNNPLVIYNQGDGWVILVYEDTSGNFQIRRSEVAGGAIRIDYDSNGKVDYNVPGKSPQTSPADYPYYWRPRITINPEAYPSDVKEYTLTNGKFTGAYKEWWNNGHLKSSMIYSSEGVASGRHVEFERTGQHKFEVTTYVGSGELREWTPPVRTDLGALFKAYDANTDGYLNSTELKTLIEQYGGLDFSPEDRTIIFNLLDLDQDGKISLKDFRSRFGNNAYTRDIPSIDLQHSVLISVSNLNNGIKSGTQTQYHPFRPEGVLRASATFSAGKLTGSFTEYHYDGTTQKLVVSYDAQGKKTGTQTERYSPDLGGGVSRITVFPTGAQSNDIKEYFPSGSLQSIYEPFIDPSNPYTAFRYTEYFDKTTLPPNLNTETNIYRRYFLDNFRLKNGVETLYSSPGVLQVGWPKVY